MFENIITFGEKDLELETSFAPLFSSTQDFNSEKRLCNTAIEVTSKKIKLEPNSALQQNLITNHDEFETSRDSFFYSPNKAIKRIFPGPAGLLSNKNSELVDTKFKENREDFTFCSQHTLSSFVDDGPWSFMKEDFQTETREQLFEKYTISWIKKEYSHKKGLDNCKAPFLSAIIQNLEIVDGKIPAIHLTLKDMTGTMNATILYSLYKKKSEYLTNGSVIVLKQFGILTSPEGHCVTITANNLLVIYHTKDTSEDPEDKSPKQQVTKIFLQDYTPEDILKEASSATAVKDTMDILQSTRNKPQFSNIYNKNKLLYGGKSVVPETVKSPSFNSPNSVQKSSSASSNTFLLPTTKKYLENDTNPYTDNTLLNTNNVLQGDKEKKFHFKKLVSTHNENRLNNNNNQVIDNAISSNKLQDKNNEKKSDIWETMLEGVDVDLLFDDF